MTSHVCGSGLVSPLEHSRSEIYSPPPWGTLYRSIDCLARRPHRTASLQWNAGDNTAGIHRRAFELKEAHSGRRSCGCDFCRPFRRACASTSLRWPVFFRARPMALTLELVDVDPRASTLPACNPFARSCTVRKLERCCPNHWFRRPNVASRDRTVPTWPGKRRADQCFADPKFELAGKPCEYARERLYESREFHRICSEGRLSRAPTFAMPCQACAAFAFREVGALSASLAHIRSLFPSYSLIEHFRGMCSLRYGWPKAAAKIGGRWLGCVH